MILGIDEAGRGPWAGPLVVGAVVLSGAEIFGLDDSKKLTKKKRQILDLEIRKKASAFGLGWVSARELDEIGMSKALELATRRAVEKIKTPYSEIIIDGTVNFLKNTGKGKYVKTVAKADAIFPTVSAASIIAKVARDDYMTKVGKKYPEYGFSSNAGYGTKKHVAAIEKFGVTAEHRLSFKPLQKYRENQDFVLGKDFGGEKLTENSKNQNPARDEKLENFKTTKQIGDLAEEKVAERFRSEGYEIIGRNLKNKFAEIDIVAKNDHEICFIEVRFRKNNRHGSGLESITRTKLNQMKFAAELFLAKYPQLAKSRTRLMAADVSGEDFEIQEIIDVE